MSASGLQHSSCSVFEMESQMGTDGSGKPPLSYQHGPRRSRRLAHLLAFASELAASIPSG